MGKEAVIAVIERRGEVIYYKASKMGFVENRYRTENKA
jgi:tRNA-intron endonuclease